MLTFLAYWKPIIESLINHNSENFNLKKRALSNNLELEDFSKYFHLLGIDILMTTDLKPIVLELNDRPSLIVRFEVDKDLKKNLILDVLRNISLDGSPVPEENASPNFQKIIPPPSDSPLYPLFTDVCTQVNKSFRVASPLQERPHYVGRKGLKANTPINPTFC